MTKGARGFGQLEGLSPQAIVATDMNLIAAIAIVESSMNPCAIGDSGKAIGICQIHQCVVEDVNYRYNTCYIWPDDCFDPAKSQDIMLSYWSIYATSDRLGHVPTDEDLARIWNGGPNGYRKDSTVPYWDAVLSVMTQ